MNNYWKHFKTITKHKMVVMKYCFKLGLYKQGLMHDLSKYRSIEFFTSARYFQGTSSPIDQEKKEKGYSVAWQHHKGHNPHHWQYWLDITRYNTKNPNGVDIKPLPMPMKYLMELVCDWIGAGKVYSKEKWTQEEPLNYYFKIKDSLILHDDTRALLEKILASISIHGIDKTFRLLKSNFGVRFLGLNDYEYDGIGQNDYNHFKKYNYERNHKN